MVSIITATHNQLSVNQLYVEYLKTYTQNKDELIIIDNHSTDGTREFFEKNCDKLIKHEHNYSYPYCQNKGIKAASYEYIALLNNDLLVSKAWDAKAIEIMEKNNIDILSFASTDHVDTYKNT